MPLIESLLPWEGQPQDGLRIAEAWREAVPDALVQSQRGLSVNGSSVTRVGTVSEALTGDGWASRHSATGTNIERAPISAGIGLTSGLGAALLAVFRTTTTTADRIIGALGSNSGSSGNTLFVISTGSPTPSNIRFIAGNQNQNIALTGSGTTVNDGAVHCALISLDRFNTSTGTGTGFLDGRLVVTGAIDNTGFGFEYQWMAAGGTRRTTDIGGFDGDVLAVIPFSRALSIDEGCSLTANPWQIFEPRRIWVPVAGSGGTTYNVSLTEAASAADAYVSALLAAAAITEAASAADAQASTAVRAASLTEAVTATDAATAQAVLNRSLSESVSATDLVAAALAAVAAVVEAASATDQQSTGPVYSVTQTETASAVDAVAAAAQLVAGLTEAGSAADAMAAARIRVALLTEPAAASDLAAAAGSAVYAVSIAELAAALDVVVGVAAGQLVLTDGYLIEARARLLEIAARPRRLEIKK